MSTNIITNNITMRKFKHTVLIVLRKVNKVLTDLGAGAGYALRR